MKFLTIQRAGLGSISIPADRVSSIAVYGDGSRVNYARADGTLDYLHDDRAPFAVLHELEAIDRSNAPAADASLRGFVEMTLSDDMPGHGGHLLLVPLDSVRSVEASAPRGRDDDTEAWVRLRLDGVAPDAARLLTGRRDPKGLIQVGVRESFAEIRARLAGATR